MRARPSTIYRDIDALFPLIALLSVLSLSLSLSLSLFAILQYSTASSLYSERAS